MPNWHTVGRIVYYAAYLGAGYVAHLTFERTGHLGFWLASIAFSGTAIVGFGRILWESSGEQK